MIKKYFSGLKFGLLLQIAVGPMCLMVFNTSKNVGLVSATLIFQMTNHQYNEKGVSKDTPIYLLNHLNKSSNQPF